MDLQFSDGDLLMAAGCDIIANDSTGSNNGDLQIGGEGPGHEIVIAAKRLFRI